MMHPDSFQELLVVGTGYRALKFTSGNNFTGHFPGARLQKTLYNKISRVIYMCTEKGLGEVKKSTSELPSCKSPL
jgi:hypothetical protein